MTNEDAIKYVKLKIAKAKAFREPHVSIQVGILNMAFEALEPIKHGEWIGAEFDGYADGNPVYDSWTCSVCHEEVESEGEPPRFRYCPNCGAKMDG